MNYSFLQVIEEYEFLRRASDNDTLQKTLPLGDKGKKPQAHSSENTT